MKLATTVLLFVGISLGGCSIFRAWNPVYNGLELDQTVAFVEDGVAVEVARFGFTNGSGPNTNVKVTNTTGETLTFRPERTRAVIGADTLSPRPEPSEAQTLAPGESASVWLYFGGTPEAGMDGPRGQTVVLMLGGVEAGGDAITLPSVEYVFPSSDFRGGRARVYPAGAE